ncbi:MAG: Uma2 family endonuclease [Blastocatellia bacterium]
MATPRRKLYYTVEEYLAFDRASEERHEYIDGQIRAMAGESDAHLAICLNVGAEMRNRLKGSDCKARTQNMKVRSGPEPKSKRFPKDFFSYPDVMVYCGDPAFHDSHRDVLLNPKVIVEILSPSTEAFDRGEKFIRYRAYNDTLTGYILVSQKNPFIEHFSRQSGGNWLLSATGGLESSLHTSSIDCQVELSEIYYGVQFPKEDAETSEEAETDRLEQE